MAMLHYLKGPITEERISKLSKRKRKRYRVGEFQELGFMFVIPMEDLDWNNKTLGEKLFFIGLILLNIYEVYYKKKSEATNDQI